MKIKTLALAPQWLLVMCAKPFLPEQHPFKRLGFRQFATDATPLAVMFGCAMWAYIALVPYVISTIAKSA